MMQREEILDELCDQTQEIGEFAGLTFELFEEYWALADARLSAFASDKMWAVIFEIVGYDNGAGEYVARIYLLGNCVKPREEFYLPHRSQILFTVQNEWNSAVEAGGFWGVNREQFSLLYRGQRHDFSLTPQDLQEAAIELSQRELASGALSPPQLLRFVCEKWGHPFFLNEDALRGLLNEFSTAFEWKRDAETQRDFYGAVGEFDELPVLSTVLEMVLQTRDWIHPKIGQADYDAGEWEIAPREAFVTLAQTLATRDLSVWNAQDATKFNSHWSNWADIDANNERAENQRIADARAAFRAYIEQIPRQERAQFLEEMQSSIEHAPPISSRPSVWTITRKGASVQIFRELSEDVAALRAEL